MVIQDGVVNVPQVGPWRPLAAFPALSLLSEVSPCAFTVLRSCDDPVEVYSEPEPGLCFFSSGVVGQGAAPTLTAPFRKHAQQLPLPTSQSCPKIRTLGLVLPHKTPDKMVPRKMSLLP